MNPRPRRSGRMMLNKLLNLPGLVSSSAKQERSDTTENYWENPSGMALKPRSARRQRSGLGAYCWLIRNLAGVETWETDTKLYLHSKGLQAWPVASCWGGL